MPFPSLDILTHHLLPKHALTTFAGFMANIKSPVIKNYLIQDFIAKYNVNMQEAREEDPTQYACFNDFFIRHLKPECRPIANAELISPVDGCVSEIGTITAGKLLQAKGRDYTVHELLACDRTISDQFNAGSFATLYLSPKDYHRVHMPIDATLTTMVHVPGSLFSVQPKTVNAIPRLFARNERLVVLFDTAVGLMAMVLVGATIVGGIGTSWHGDVRRGKQPMHYGYSDQINGPITLQQAAEMGYFKLGSTVVLLFAEQIKWQENLVAGQTIRFGEALGVCFR